MEWALMPLRRYADFEGRSRRMEYWMFSLAVFAVSVVVEMLLFSTGGFSHGFNLLATLLVVPLVLFSLALFIPSLAVTVRRLHDQDKSGWFILLGLIPVIGGLVVLVLMCLGGTPGENRFGPDPKAGPLPASA